MKIKYYKFQEESISDIKKDPKGKDWPVVYIINNKNEAYIGETISAYNRTLQHLANPKRRFLKELHIIEDDNFNKSATLDIESSLIELMSADEKFKLQNSNSGLVFHKYNNMHKFSQESPFFKQLWNMLKQRKLVNKEIEEIKNSDIFKYSPYKSLNSDQINARDSIITKLSNSVVKGEKFMGVVSGVAGTGKTILATYLVKLLTDPNFYNLDFNPEDSSYIQSLIELHNYAPNFKIGYIVPMDSLRSTMKRVFKAIKGLPVKIIMSPKDIVDSEYLDLVIVDEAHRLRRRKNLVSGAFPAFSKANIKLGLDPNAGTELDWILLKSKHQIFFYDRFQTIRPTDIRKEQFKKVLDNCSFEYILEAQMRSLGGEEFYNYIKDIFTNKNPKPKSFDKNFEFKLFDNISDMRIDIMKKDKNPDIGLSKMVAGYAWQWKSKKDKKGTPYDKRTIDIKIDNEEFIWNTTPNDWINSENSINEMGCIHTVQGYDLNYIGIVMGNEISYDKAKNKIIVIKDNYYDIMGKRSINEYDELFEYITNIYITLFSRGIKGVYVYICDKDLKDYLKQYFL